MEGTKEAFEAWFRKQYAMPSDVPFQWDSPYVEFGLKCWEAALMSVDADTEQAERPERKRRTKSEPAAKEAPAACAAVTEESGAQQKSWVGSWTEVIRNLPDSQE